jgi:ribA/ribD-fused uncharacterized protein
MAILFWAVWDRERKVYHPYGYLSNFAPYPFTVDGILYKTSEHYYQSKKFYRTEDSLRVLNAATPKEAASLGRSREFELRYDWTEVKDNIMREAVEFKFGLNPRLAQMLLSTGEEELIEGSPIDWYWGWGKDRTGKNMLGKILMEERDHLRGK